MSSRQIFVCLEEAGNVLNVSKQLNTGAAYYCIVEKDILVHIYLCEIAVFVHIKY